MSKPLLYVTFKRYPELGRMKVVNSVTAIDEICGNCALDAIENLRACKDVLIVCGAKEIHFERADERQAKAG